MITLAIQILWVLIAVCILVGVGWLVIYVLNALGIIVPSMLVRIALIIIGLLVLIYCLGLIVGAPGLGVRMSGPGWR